MTVLPTPPDAIDRDPSRAEAWVAEHLGHLTDDPEVVASPRFRGGQTAADAALAALDISGYRRQRNEVWPEERRGASAMSPYVRYGFVQLPELWSHVGDAPKGDAKKYRDELLWQEYARHWYARLGERSRDAVRNHLPVRELEVDPWDPAMRCMEVTVDELERDGWLVNQTRMWLASQWAVRHGVDWRDGEERFFRHLVDGSRAANRSGWQWTTGAGSHEAYGFSRYQVEKRAPQLCGECDLRNSCPIEGWPEDPDLVPVEPRVPELSRDPDVEATAGPREPRVTGEPEAVWLTAESLGDADPAMAAHPDLPVVFVFDEPLLDALRLSSKRLVFLAESIGDLATRRDVEVRLGRVTEELAGRPVAATFAPVPGWKRRAASLDVVATHPWPWLRRPHGGKIQSYTAWKQGLRD